MKQGKVFALFVITLFFLSVTVSISAAGNSVSITDIRDEVEGGWHETYEAHGRTIVVDVDIYIPDVDVVPIVQVGFPPTLTPLGDSYFDSFVDETGMGYSMESTSGTFMGKGDSIEITGPDAHAENSPLSLQEAQDALVGLIQQYENQTGSLSLELRSAMAQSRRYMKEAEGLNLQKPTTQMGAYYIEYYQLFHGIPFMTVHPFDISVPPQARMESPRGSINGLIASKDDYTLYMCPAIETAVLKDDIPLVPFEEVKQAFENLIKAGYIREVFEIRLGYYCYVDPINPGQTFILQPVWQLRGIIAQQASHPDPELPTLTAEYTRQYSGQYAVVEAFSGERLGERAGWEYADPSLYENK